MVAEEAEGKQEVQNSVQYLHTCRADNISIVDLSTERQLHLCSSCRLLVSDDEISIQAWPQHSIDSLHKHPMLQKLAAAAAILMH